MTRQFALETGRDAIKFAAEKMEQAKEINIDDLGGVSNYQASLDEIGLGYPMLYYGINNRGLDPTNFPLAVVRLLSEKKVAAEIQKNNVLWIYESNDFFAALRSKTKYGYLKNFFKPHIAVLFASDDLRPLLYEIGDLARKKMKKIFRHV